MEALVATDLLAGVQKNAWLGAAIAALHGHPHVLMQCFCESPDHLISGSGWYTIRLFDLSENGQAVEVCINDLVPMQSLQKAGSDLNNWTPLGLHPQGGDIYTLLLEKALAKMMGGYDDLASGTALFAWATLTGCEEAQAMMKDARSRNWQELEVSDMSWRNGFRGEETADYDGDELFQRLYEAANRGDVIAASVGTQGLAFSGFDPVLKSGLVAGIVYGVCTIGVFGSLRMVKLRNVWGSTPDRQWNGPWGHESATWGTQQGNAVQRETGDKGSRGLFWMEWTDFVEQWDTIMVAQMRQ